MKDSIEIPIPEMQQSSEFEIKNLKKNLNPKSKSTNRIKTFNNNNDENDIVNQRTFSKRKKSSTPNKFFSSSSNNFFKSKLQNINKKKLNLSSDFSTSSNISPIQLQNKFQYYLGKLNDNSTKEVSFKNLKNIINKYNSQENLRIYLTCLNSFNQNSSISAKEIYALLYGYISYIYKDNLLDTIDNPPNVIKTINRILKVIREKYLNENSYIVHKAASHSIIDIYKNCMPKDNINNVFVIFFEPLFNILSTGIDKIIQNGAGICLSDLIYFLSKEENNNNNNENNNENNFNETLLYNLIERLIKICIKSSNINPYSFEALYNLMNSTKIEHYLIYLKDLYDKIYSVLCKENKDKYNFLLKINCLNLLNLIAIKVINIVDISIGYYSENIFKVIEFNTKDKITKVALIAKETFKNWLELKNIFEDIDNKKRNIKSNNNNFDNENNNIIVLDKNDYKNNNNLVKKMDKLNFLRNLAKMAKIDNKNNVNVNNFNDFDGFTDVIYEDGMAKALHKNNVSNKNNSKNKKLKKEINDYLKYSNNVKKYNFYNNEIKNNNYNRNNNYVIRKNEEDKINNNLQNSEFHKFNSDNLNNNNFNNNNNNDNFNNNNNKNFDDAELIIYESNNNNNNNKSVSSKNKNNNNNQQISNKSFSNNNNNENINNVPVNKNDLNNLKNILQNLFNSNLNSMNKKIKLINNRINELNNRINEIYLKLENYKNHPNYNNNNNNKLNVSNDTIVSYRINNQRYTGIKKKINPEMPEGLNRDKIYKEVVEDIKKELNIDDYNNDSDNYNKFKNVNPIINNNNIDSSFTRINNNIPYKNNINNNSFNIDNNNNNNYIDSTNSNSNNNNLSNLWNSILIDIENRFYNKAYEKILNFGDDIYLLRLLYITGPVFDKIDKILSKKILLRINMICRSYQIQYLLINLIKLSLKFDVFNLLNNNEKNDILDSLYEFSGMENNLGNEAASLYTKITQ